MEDGSTMGEPGLAETGIEQLRTRLAEIEEQLQRLQDEDADRGTGFQVDRTPLQAEDDDQRSGRIRQLEKQRDELRADLERLERPAA